MSKTALSEMVFLSNRPSYGDDDEESRTKDFLHRCARRLLKLMTFISSGFVCLVDARPARAFGPHMRWNHTESHSF